jgi:hypothetical protein
LRERERTSPEDAREAASNRQGAKNAKEDTEDLSQKKEKRP